jgi:ferredoxin
MNDARIYFFTGAGNSFATARSLSEAWGGVELVNIATLLDQEEIPDASSLIGIVFPVYGNDVPKIVQNWLRTLCPAEDTVLFAVCTCGIAPGRSHLTVDAILKEAGSHLTWGFSILQPQAGIGSKVINTPDVVSERLVAQKRRVAEIERYISGNGPPVIEHSGRFSEFLNRSTLKVFPTLIKLVGQLIVKGMKNMTFHPAETCNGCEICVRLCPVGNITMTDNRPVWGKDCIGCMGCYHWCPEDAVKSVELDMIQSSHPEVRVQEILATR